MGKRAINITVDLSQKPWMNLDEAIAYIGFGSKETFRQWREKNLIPFSKVGGSIAYRRTDLDRLLEKNMVMPHEY